MCPHHADIRNRSPQKTERAILSVPPSTQTFVIPLSFWEDLGQAWKFGPTLVYPTPLVCPTLVWLALGAWSGGPLHGLP